MQQFIGWAMVVIGNGAIIISIAMPDITAWLVCVLMILLGWHLLLSDKTKLKRKTHSNDKK